ncbi:MAG: Ubiquitin-conjugating enzyme E2 6 [Vezdaea acicularis]|nr:MAG: Ubiquitin-conjugating enzyme E2 6 [Vezdaea acicularis]
MATPQANKRLAREYKTISENPPPYIVAHPSENNILEWHYILTGPPDTPYTGGQYWGTLMFPPDYPFAPPAIRMFTPSGRFQPSSRLCLSISDFHPKSFNPAWEVSTILIGLMSFMTSEEMTTGSVSATSEERKWAAQKSRSWNSTNAKFRAEWPELDEENKKLGALTTKRRPVARIVEETQAARDVGQSWMRRHRWLVAAISVFGYVLIARFLRDGGEL